MYFIRNFHVSWDVPTTFETWKWDALTFNLYVYIVDKLSFKIWISHTFRNPCNSVFLQTYWNEPYAAYIISTIFVAHPF